MRIYFTFVFSAKERMEAAYSHFLIFMSLLALFVFVALYKTNAGYGMFYSKNWGWSLSNKLGWVLMEAPVFFSMTLLWANSARKWDLVPLLIFMLFQLHYFNRSFVYPLLLRGKSRMPVLIVLMAVVFNLCNALMQGGWLFYFAPEGRYGTEWLLTPQFIIGCLVFLSGMVINIHSDHIIRNLRKKGDSSHYLPRGGLFRYVSAANYFGELVEWLGFALLTWSWPGLVFAWWTFANLAPRAAALYRKYELEYGEEFTKEERKKIIPFIY